MVSNECNDLSTCVSCTMLCVRTYTSEIKVNVSETDPTTLLCVCCHIPVEMVMSPDQLQLALIITISISIWCILVWQCETSQACNKLKAVHPNNQLHIEK